MKKQNSLRTLLVQKLAQHLLSNDLKRKTRSLKTWKNWLCSDITTLWKRIPESVLRNNAVNDRTANRPFRLVPAPLSHHLSSLWDGITFSTFRWLCLNFCKEMDIIMRVIATNAVTWDCWIDFDESRIVF